MKCHVACLIALLLICPQAWANPGADQKHIDKIKKKVADCVDHPRRVSTETYDDRRLQGTISEAGPDTFVLTNSGRSTTLSYAEVNKIKWPSALSKQAKVVIGAVAVTGALFGLVVLLGGLRG